ncbi:MAG: tetraacyldisaccharide 4'-kinase [Bacteriovoracales bacterium]
MVRKLLYPFSFIWGGIHSFRRFAYRVEIYPSKKFKVPVISIGNLSFGGTNKTPFTLFLSQLLNKKVAVLMRGYKGKLENKGGILKVPSPLDFGDEAVLLFNSNPEIDIIVGKKRSQNLEKYYPQINSDVVLLDDGFQHLAIKRDLDIVLLDTTMDLLKYKTFPVGNLRENLNSLSDADVVVYTRCDQVNSIKLEKLKSLISPYLRQGVISVESALVPSGVFNHENQMDLDFLKGKKVHAFCGIGNPHSFFSSLEKLGAKIYKKNIFRDHHFFSEKELTRMLKDKGSKDTIFLTTEKDFVRIPKTFQNGRIFYLGARIKVLKGLDELEEKIKTVIHP